jgi:hypothetical protein
MVILNEGQTSEFSLRLVLESEVHGREYFDSCADTAEILEAVNRLVRSASEETTRDGVERVVSVAIVPKSNYGDECSYGAGIGS